MKNREIKKWNTICIGSERKQTRYLWPVGVLTCFILTDKEGFHWPNWSSRGVKPTTLLQRGLGFPPCAPRHASIKENEQEPLITWLMEMSTSHWILSEDFLLWTEAPEIKGLTSDFIILEIWLKPWRRKSWNNRESPPSAEQRVVQWHWQTQQLRVKKVKLRSLVKFYFTHRHTHTHT